MLVKPFSGEPDESAASQKQEPEYAFDGFDIVFSVKIALTSPSLAPPTPPVTAAAAASYPGSHQRGK